jgi:hypothetical protein
VFTGDHLANDSGWSPLAQPSPTWSWRRNSYESGLVPRPAFALRATFPVSGLLVLGDFSGNRCQACGLLESTGRYPAPFIGQLICFSRWRRIRSVSNKRAQFLVWLCKGWHRTQDDGFTNCSGMRSTATFLSRSSSFSTGPLVRFTSLHCPVTIPLPGSVV